jgi:hypothetical protein
VAIKTSLYPPNDHKSPQNYHQFSPQNPETPLKNTSKDAGFLPEEPSEKNYN